MDLALNNLQWLVRHKTKLNQTKLSSVSYMNNLERLSFVMSSHKKSSAPSFKASFHDIWLNISKCLLFPGNNLKRERE